MSTEPEDIRPLAPVADDAATRARLAHGRRCVLAAAALWSLSGVLTKLLTGLDGPTIAFYRGLFAGLALLPLIPRERFVFRWGLIPQVCVFGAMTGFYIGSIKATTAANAIFLQYSAPIWIIPLSYLLMRERPDRRSVAGIGLAGLGVLVIVVWTVTRPSPPGSGLNHPLGIALGLTSGLSYAMVAVGLRYFRDLDPMWLSAVNNLGGSLVIGAFVLTMIGPITWPGLLPALGLVAFGIVQMAIPYVLFARGLREIPAPEAGLLSLLEPVLNPIWVILFVGEYPAPETWVGGALLLAGVALRYVPLPRLWRKSTT